MVGGGGGGAGGGGGGDGGGEGGGGRGRGRGRGGRGGGGIGGGGGGGGEGSYSTSVECFFSGTLTPLPGYPACVPPARSGGTWRAAARWSAPRGGSETAPPVAGNGTSGTCARAPSRSRAPAAGPGRSRLPSRGRVFIHSSTFQLNLSAVCGVGGARGGCVARVQGVLGGVYGV